MDLLVSAGYLLAALYVMAHLLVDPAARVQRSNPSDQAFFEFVLANAGKVLAHGANPFFTRQMNMPDGVNLMANTSILGMSLPLAPLTLLFGTGVSYAVLSVVALAATATSWYAMLARHVVSSRFAAAVGGWFCAFAPGAVAQANGHPNIVAQFLVPWIVWRATKLREPGHLLRNAAALAALVVWQFFINEEILLLTALAYGIVALVYAVWHRRTVRPQVGRFVRGVLVAGALSAVALAYPLWFQFFGPQHYRGLPPLIQLYGIDLWSYPSYASESLTGNVNTGTLYAPNPTEQNAFLGWGLILLVGVIVWRLRRSALAIGLATAGLSLALCSLGLHIVVRGHHTGIPGPWEVLSRLPGLDTVVAPRLAITVIPVIGMLLALGCDEFLAHVEKAVVRPAPPWRLAGAALLAVALVPIAPTPLAATGRVPVPAFITDGTYREYVPDGRSLVPIPLTRPPHNDGLYFSARANLGFAFPRGYFLGPGEDPAHPGQLGARYDAPYLPTSSLLEGVADTGVVPALGPADSANALHDLRYWRAAALILPFDSDHEYQLYQVTSQLVGFRPVPVGGVWLWDVRGIVG